QRHQQAGPHHLPHRRAQVGALHALQQDRAVGIGAMGARQQRHRCLRHILRGQGAGDEGDVERQRGDRDACPEDEMGEPVAQASGRCPGLRAVSAIVHPPL
ncbi:MAG: hypothetical protein ACK56I_24650, partial [bacterium]